MAIEIAPWQSGTLPRVTNRSTGEVYLDLWDSAQWYGEAALEPDGKVLVLLQNQKWNQSLRLRIDPLGRQFEDEREPGRWEPLAKLAAHLGAGATPSACATSPEDPPEYSIEWSASNVCYHEGSRRVNVLCYDDDSETTGSKRTLVGSSFTHWIAARGYIPVTAQERRDILDRVAMDGHRRGWAVEVV